MGCPRPGGTSVPSQRGDVQLFVCLFWMFVCCCCLLSFVVCLFVVCLFVVLLLCCCCLLLFCLFFVFLLLLFLVCCLFVCCFVAVVCLLLLFVVICLFVVCFLLLLFFVFVVAVVCLFVVVLLLFVCCCCLLFISYCCLFVCCCVAVVCLLLLFVVYFLLLLFVWCFCCCWGKGGTGGGWVGGRGVVERWLQCCTPRLRQRLREARLKCGLTAGRRAVGVGRTEGRQQRLGGGDRGHHDPGSPAGPAVHHPPLLHLHPQTDSWRRQRRIPLLHRQQLHQHQLRRIRGHYQNARLSRRVYETCSLSCLPERELGSRALYFTGCSLGSFRPV